MTGDPMEDALRAAFAERAARAPDGEPVVARVLSATVGRPVGDRPHARWRSWTLPLIAAASVVGVVAAAVGIEHYGAAAPGGPVAPVASHPHAVATSASPGHSSAPVSGTPSAPSRPTSFRPANRTAPTGVRVLDLTFIGADDGWALASANCLRTTGRCTALLRTTDGRTWAGVPGAVFNVTDVQGCADPCVEHLRFATDRIGYAYGPDALFLTRDGGATWRRQPGRGAEALETADGSVIRLVSAHSGCPGPCDIRVQLAAIGSTSWTTVRLAPTAVGGAEVALVRNGPRATVLVTTGQAGWVPRSTVYSSADNGRSWTDRADPCVPTGATPATIGALQAAQGVDGSSVLLCTGTTSSRNERIAISVDGTTYAVRAPIPFAPLGYWLTLGAVSAQIVFAADASYLRRSADGGSTWQPVASLSNEPSFIGFESAVVGRMLTDGGRSIWTTRDGGRTWTRYRFA